MSLSQKVQAVEELYADLHQETLKFQGWSKLTCKTGCGKCCHKADIEATVLEFLPFAEAAYQENKALEWLERLAQHQGPLCALLDPTHHGVGMCTQYEHRALICRLFGFSARINKYARKELVTCNTIKTEQATAYASAAGLVAEGATVPVMSHFHMRLATIDPGLARDFYPINEAIRRALETVLQYYAYRS